MDRASSSFQLSQECPGSCWSVDIWSPLCQLCRPSRNARGSFHTQRDCSRLFSRSVPDTQDSCWIDLDGGPTTLQSSCVHIVFRDATSNRIRNTFRLHNLRTCPAFCSNRAFSLLNYTLEWDTTSNFCPLPPLDSLCVIWRSLFPFRALANRKGRWSRNSFHRIYRSCTGLKLPCCRLSLLWGGLGHNLNRMSDHRVAHENPWRGSLRSRLRTWHWPLLNLLVILTNRKYGPKRAKYPHFSNLTDSVLLSFHMQTAQ